MQYSNDNRKKNRKIDRLTFLINSLKKIRSVQSGLLELSELASKVNELKEFYPALNQVVSSFLKADNFYVVLENEQHKLEVAYFVDKQGDIEGTLELDDDGITEYVYRTQKPVLFDRESYRQLLKDQCFVPLNSEPEFWFGVPLMHGQHCIGVMAIQSYDSPVTLTEQAKVLFESLGLHLITAISRVKRREFLEQEIKSQTAKLQLINSNLLYEIKQRSEAEQLQEVLFQISEMNSSQIGIDDFYQALHKCLAQLMDVTNCYISLIEENTLAFPFYVNQYSKEASPRTLSNGLIEYTIGTRCSHLINNQKAQLLMERGDISPETLKNNPFACWLGAPLKIDDQVIGVIAVQSYDNDDINEYSDKDLQILTFVSHHIARAIERKLSSDKLQKSYDELENKIDERTQELRQANLFLRMQVEERKKVEQRLFHQANHDTLTALPNRALFQSKVESVIARTKRHPDYSFALLFIDLDNFKKINDQLGHQVGDEFLIEISERLLRCVRDNDVVARLGGDEFVILLDLLTNNDMAEEIANRIIDDVSRPFGNETAIHSGASIGIAMFDQQYTRVDEIMRDADLAMYQAKSLGRGQFVVFSESLRNQSQEQASIQNVIKNAIVDGHLYLKQQSIVTSDSQKNVCYLVERRWDHTILDDVEFSHEMMHLLDAQYEMAFETEYIKQLLALVNANKDLFMMPVSGKYLSHVKNVNELIAIFNRLETSSHVCLLFSEAELSTMGDSSLKNIKRIKRAGIHVGLHQFGKELSSASLLTKSLFDFVLFDQKMIRSVAANPANAILLKSMIDLAIQLNIRPIICGVDQVQHLDRVQAFNVDLICGEHVSEQSSHKSSTRAGLTVKHSA